MQELTSLIDRWSMWQTRNDETPKVHRAPGEKHWHGATPATAMTHIAIQEKFDGKIVDWMKQVSDEQYQG